MPTIYELDERLESIDKCINNYRSITEFRKAHPKLYWYINYYKIKKYDNYFIPQKFSSQQMICKQLTEKFKFQIIDLHYVLKLSI